MTPVNGTDRKPGMMGVVMGVKSSDPTPTPAAALYRALSAAGDHRAHHCSGNACFRGQISLRSFPS